MAYIQRSKVDKIPAFQSVEPTLRIDKFFWEFDTPDVKNPTYDSKELDNVWYQTIKLCLRIKEIGE